MDAKDPKLLHADCKDSHQAARMHRLVTGFAGRNNHFVVLSLHRLKAYFLFQADDKSDNISVDDLGEGKLNHRSNYNVVGTRPLSNDIHKHRVPPCREQLQIYI